MRLGKLLRSRMLHQTALTVVATLTVAAMVTGVHAYLRGSRAVGAAPTAEQLIPDGKRVVHVSGDGAADVLERVEIEKGKSVLIRTDYDVDRVALGDPSRAGLVVTDARSIQLVAKEPGDTNVMLWDAKGTLRSALDVHVGVHHAQLLAELTRVLAERNVQVDMAGEAVILRGKVLTVEERERAEQIANAFFDGMKEPGEKDPHVINLIDVDGNHQVMIEVVMAEMNRSLGRQVATDWQTLVKDGVKTYALGSLTGGGALTGDVADAIAGGGNLFGGSLGGKTDVRAFIQLAKQNGLAKILAEPTLVARSGHRASFLAGGEVPLLEPSGLGTVSVELKPFGVGIEFMPTVLGPDRIHLEITPEVSEPDDSLGIQVNGVSVPGFTTRRATTAVELGDGQSFAIAGLLSEKTTTVVDRVPGIGDLPVIGALFSSREFQNQETELVIIVTPRLVEPLDPGPRPLPTDHYQKPDDVDFYLLGRSESRKPHAHPTDFQAHPQADREDHPEAGEETPVQADSFEE
jgi:pilus assembly protein CpaC